MVGIKVISGASKPLWIIVDTFRHAFKIDSGGTNTFEVGRLDRPTIHIHRNQRTFDWAHGIRVPGFLVLHSEKFTAFDSPRITLSDGSLHFGGGFLPGHHDNSDWINYGEIKYLITLFNDGPPPLASVILNWSMKDIVKTISSIKIPLINSIAKFETLWNQFASVGEKIQFILNFYNFAKGDDQYWQFKIDDLPNDQLSWRFCHKCKGLFWNGDGPPHRHTGVCPTGDAHDPTQSGDYRLYIHSTDILHQVQNNWVFCYKCNGLFWAGGQEYGKCPAGGSHNPTQSMPYLLGVAKNNYKFPQPWKYCFKCKGLFWINGGSHGTCPAGGSHDDSQSGTYYLDRVSG